MFFNYELFTVETSPLHVFIWWLVPGSSDPDCWSQAVLQPVYYLFLEKHLRANNPHGFLQYLCVNFLEDTDLWVFFPKVAYKEHVFEVHAKKRTLQTMYELQLVGLDARNRCSAELLLLQGQRERWLCWSWTHSELRVPR